MQDLASLALTLPLKVASHFDDFASFFLFQIINMHVHWSSAFWSDGVMFTSFISVFEREGDHNIRVNNDFFFYSRHNNMPHNQGFPFPNIIHVSNKFIVTFLYICEPLQTYSHTVPSNWPCNVTWSNSHWKLWAIFSLNYHCAILGMDWHGIFLGWIHRVVPLINLVLHFQHCYSTSIEKAAFP